MHETAFFGRLEAWGNEVKYRRRQSLRRTRYFNNSQGIDGIYGLWLADDVLYADYGGLSLNLSRFLEALDQTMPQNAAAFETITGQWAASKGFSNVEFMRLVPEVPYAGQGYTEVPVIFQP